MKNTSKRTKFGKSSEEEILFSGGDCGTSCIIGSGESAMSMYRCSISGQFKIPPLVTMVVIIVPATERMSSC
jgi:hypothetical protein